jgi:uncharacterized protein
MLETHSVPVPDNGRISARVYRSDTPPFATLVLAHGAGAGQTHPFMVRTADGLAGRGLDVVTFDFPYIEARRRRPDANAVLESTWRAVVEWTRTAGVHRAAGLFAGGKSMGGRIASQVVAADGPGLGVEGLVFLWYPLHPPGKPGELRVRHFARLEVPMLFLQGTRDAFGTPDELRPWVAGSPSRAEIVPVDGGDHSFALPRAMQAAQDETFDRLYERITRWMLEVL